MALDLKKMERSVDKALSRPAKMRRWFNNYQNNKQKNFIKRLLKTKAATA